jgi:hypothetical protein
MSDGPRLTLDVEYDREPLRLTSEWVEACEAMLTATCRMMQGHDGEYADCWIYGVCFWHNGPEFLFGGSWGDVSLIGDPPVVAKVEVPPPEPSK